MTVKEVADRNSNMFKSGVLHTINIARKSKRTKFFNANLVFST